MTKSDSIYDFIYDIVRQVPHGKVTSYGAIARCLGAGGSARLVGWAMNAAHNRADIPAHRVVNRNGLLSGKMHFETPERMQQLLEEEGIEVRDNQVQNFKQVFWDPAELA